MENNEIFSTLDSLLSTVDLTGVTAENSGTGYEDLPEGYYLSEVEKAELTTSKAGDPMIKFQFKIVEDGVGTGVNEKGVAVLTKVERSKNRKIFKYYPLNDEQKVKRFVADMLKFEGENPGTPLLGQEYFTTSEILEEALSLLTGLRIYVQAQKPTKEGATGNFYNLISWKRATVLELPL